MFLRALRDFEGYLGLEVFEDIDSFECINDVRSNVGHESYDNIDSLEGFLGF